MKKTTKRILLLGATLSSLLILSGCVDLYHSGPNKGMPTGKGLVYNLLVHPMSEFVDLFAHNLHLGYGLGVIIVTLIVRLVILPLGLNQAYRSTYMQEKTAYLAPVFQPINDRLKKAREAKDQAQMMAIQQELMQAQRDNGVSMLSLSNMGCLPLLIQYPFFMALYYAARYTPGISTGHFLGMDLGKPNNILAVIAGIFYLGQTLISTVGMTDEQKQQGRMMLFISPLSILIFAFISPAGVALYWTVGGLVMVIQQLIITFIMKPRMRVRIDKEMKENPPKMRDLKDVTATTADVKPAQAIETSSPKPRNASGGKGRNAGKQKR